MKTETAIHILRNRHGHADGEVREAGLAICEAYENMKVAYENMRDFAQSKGLDIATSNVAAAIASQST